MLGRLRFLLQWRFWVNYAVILAVTCWVPLLKQTVTMTGADGKVIQQTTLSVPAYASWRMLFTRGPGAGHGLGVGMHTGLCFAITALVWFLMYRPVIQDLPDASSAPESGDKEPVLPGDTPHE